MMKQLWAVLAVVMALSLTGCLVSEEEQKLYDYVIEELIDEGYIGEDDELYCPDFTEVSAAVPSLVAVNYVYEDEDGGQYLVRIFAIDGEDYDEATVVITTDFELTKLDSGNYIIESYKAEEKLTIELPTALDLSDEE